MSSDETRIVRSEENMNEAKVNQSKKPIDKVLSYIGTINDLSDIWNFEKEWSYRGTI